MLYVLGWQKLFKIDFHVHTAERSSCAISSQTEQIRAAIKSGLQAIAITDHSRLVPEPELAQLNRDFAPFRILNGIEITTDGEDWLVLGVTDPILEAENWTYPQLHQFVHARGGIIILAHPFRFRPEIKTDLVTYTPDALELRSNNIRLDLVPQIKELADSLHIPTLCNSDAHYTGSIGRYYNIFDNSHLEMPHILAEIKSGAMRPSLS